MGSDLGEKQDALFDIEQSTKVIAQAKRAGETNLRHLLAQQEADILHAGEVGCTGRQVDKAVLQGERLGLTDNSWQGAGSQNYQPKA